MLNGLDLFSGYGGISLALRPWVLPKAYCEADRYAQSILLSRMSGGELYQAPIWDDVRTLTGKMLPQIDMVYGGFPCQDISSAGRGAGLDGERSSLYWQLHRLVAEIHPAFVFLENVPAIRTRGLDRVVGSLSELGYDCRWTVVSAEEVGAPHLRKRWFLLAHAGSQPGGEQSRGWIGADGEMAAESTSDGQQERMAYPTEPGRLSRESSHRPTSDGQAESRRENHGWHQSVGGCSEDLAYADCAGCGYDIESDTRRECFAGRNSATCSSWWDTEPDVGRVANGVEYRVDRLKCCGNGVVPRQAKAAFARLIGTQ